MENWFFYACLWLGFVSAMVAGVFQSFSDFVMAGLERAKPSAGIESMQQINRTVFRSVFLTAFLSLVPLTGGFALYAMSQVNAPGRTFVIAAAATYFVAVFVVTVAFNVPMNRQLDRLDRASREAAAYWRTYGKVWTRWNHLRTIGSAATAALFLLAAAAFGSAI